MNNYTCINVWHTITHPCPYFKEGLAKPPLKLGLGWWITSHSKLWKGITYPCRNLRKTMSVKENHVERVTNTVKVSTKFHQHPAYWWALWIWRRTRFDPVSKTQGTHHANGMESWKLCAPRISVSICHSLSSVCHIKGPYIWNNRLGRLYRYFDGFMNETLSWKFGQHYMSQ